MEVCGADINISHVRMATEHLDTWEALMGSRKSPLRQAGIVGLGTLFAFLTRSDTLEEMVQRISERLRIKGRAILWSHAEACMDVDKPHQLELLREDLAKQQRREKARVARAKAKSSVKKKPTVKTSPSAEKKATVKAKSKAR
jgi:hypothetical protein